PTEIYTLSLHDALPISDFDLGISAAKNFHVLRQHIENCRPTGGHIDATLVNLQTALAELNIEIFQLFDQRHGHFEQELAIVSQRSEEHMSELQSLRHLV